MFFAAYHRLKPLSRQAVFGYLIMVASLIALTASCASPGPEPKTTNHPVWLTNQKSVTLLANATLAKPLDFERQVEIRYQKQVYYMNLMLQANSTRFDLVAFNSFGNQIFELAQDRLGVQYQTSLPLGNIKAEYLVADFQIAFYPETAVRSMIESAGLRFSQVESEGIITRQIFDGETLIIIAEIGDKTWRYQNFLRDYEYSFQ